MYVKRHFNDILFQHFTATFDLFMKEKKISNESKVSYVSDVPMISLFRDIFFE